MLSVHCMYYFYKKIYNICIYSFISKLQNALFLFFKKETETYGIYTYDTYFKFTKHTRFTYSVWH